MQVPKEIVDRIIEESKPELKLYSFYDSDHNSYRIHIDQYNHMSIRFESINISHTKIERLNNMISKLKNKEYSCTIKYDIFEKFGSHCAYAVIGIRNKLFYITTGSQLSSNIFSIDLSEISNDKLNKIIDILEHLYKCCVDNM